MRCVNGEKDGSPHRTWRITEEESQGSDITNEHHAAAPSAVIHTFVDLFTTCAGNAAGAQQKNLGSQLGTEVHGKAATPRDACRSIQSGHPKSGFVMTCGLVTLLRW